MFLLKHLNLVWCTMIFWFISLMLNVSRWVRRYEGHLVRVHLCGLCPSPWWGFVAPGSEDKCVSYVLFNDLYPMGKWHSVVLMKTSLSLCHTLGESSLKWNNWLKLFKNSILCPTLFKGDWVVLCSKTPDWLLLVYMILFSCVRIDKALILSACMC